MFRQRFIWENNHIYEQKYFRVHRIRFFQQKIYILFYIYVDEIWINWNKNTNVNVSDTIQKNLIIKYYLQLSSALIRSKLLDIIIMNLMRWIILTCPWITLLGFSSILVAPAGFTKPISGVSIITCTQMFIFLYCYFIIW